MCICVGDRQTRDDGVEDGGVYQNLGELTPNNSLYHHHHHHHHYHYYQQDEPQQLAASAADASDEFTDHGVHGNNAAEQSTPFNHLSSVTVSSLNPSLDSKYIVCPCCSMCGH